MTSSSVENDNEMIVDDQGTDNQVTRPPSTTKFGTFEVISEAPTGHAFEYVNWCIEKTIVSHI